MTEEQPLVARKVSVFLPMSREALIDAGVILAGPEDEYVRPPLSRRARVKWWLQGRTDRIRRQVGGWIYPEDLNDDEGWWGQ